MWGPFGGKGGTGSEAWFEDQEGGNPDSAEFKQLTFVVDGQAMTRDELRAHQKKQAEENS